MIITSRTFSVASYAIVALSLTLGSNARAADLTKEASRIDHEARELFSQTRYRLAARKFEKANGLAPHPATMFNAGVAWTRAGDLPRAADAFQTCLQMEGLDVKRTEQAKELLERLRQKLCWVRIERPSGAIVSVEHLRDAAVPVGVHLVPGAHRVEVRLPNSPERFVDFECVAGKAMILAITQLPSSAGSSASGKQSHHAPATSKPTNSQAHRASLSTTLGWVSVLSGAAAAVTGTYFGVSTLHQRDIFEASGRTDVQAHDSAVRSRTLTNVFLGIAVVGTAAGVWLLWPEDPRKAGEEPRRSSAWIRVGPTWVSTQVRF